MIKIYLVGTSAAVDMGVDISRAIVYSSNGYVTGDNYLLIAILFFVSFAGSWIGEKILKKVSQDNFPKIVLIQIALIGLVMIYRGVVKFIA